MSLFMEQCMKVLNIFMAKYERFMNNFGNKRSYDLQSLGNIN